jgi:hypothetical protein
VTEDELGELLGRRMAHLAENDRATIADCLRRLAARHAHLHLASLKDRIGAGVP